MNNTKTDAKSMKKQYVKSIFINAVKSIILREGISHVTARKIGEITGYSYATMYHYFSDLNELFLETKLVMIQDMIQCGKEKFIQSTDPLQLIKAQTRFPIDYYMDSPNIFEFFYCFKLDERNEMALKSLDIEKGYWDIYLPFVEKGTIKRSDIPVIARTIMYAVYGMITLYLSNNGLTREDIYQDMDRMIDLMLKEGKSDENER